LCSQSNAPKIWCYNKRNPKKGIESNLSRRLRFADFLMNLGYNKRNPKKGIERLEESHSRRGASGRPVTTKEIPKRELRGRYPRYGFLTLGLLASGSYNKRNPKKGIESIPREDE
jgi:hypothetical protein